MRRLLAFVAMPLAIAPLVLGAPRLLEELEPHDDRGRLSAPDVRAPSPPPIPPHPQAVPVLVYHGVALDGAAPDRWTVTRVQLARQLAGLRRAGYAAVSAATYLRFVRGEPLRLPRRPVLITFDDGRLDSYRGADGILERSRMRAVMFAITERLGDRYPGYLRASELRQMRASGRWDIALHAGLGHRLVAAADGGRGPFYATRKPGELLAQWQTRVTHDLDVGARRLRAAVPGARTDLFAVPYSDYGQPPSRDPRIPATLRKLWMKRFAATFVQRDSPGFSTPQPRAFVGRLEIGRDMSAEELLGWLDHGARSVRRRSTPRR